ncbi:MAG TPA: serine hydrolase [Caulobacteraceae bacterium]|jgi:CubicO group peptidase (beta-lactamase class C family)|nr:serine hydrolase [Caulobacteraceae bacterium]
MIEQLNTTDAADLRLVEALRCLVPIALRATGEPGLSLALARRGRMVWAAGFGLADIARREAMTPDHVVKVGSMSKPYVATAVMQLVEAGLVSLDERADAYLPFVVENPLGDRPVLVRDLLVHQSGLCLGDAGISRVETPRPLDVALRSAYAGERQPAYEGTRSPLWSAKVGEAWQYSNLGTATLGLIVERTNRERLSFGDYVQRHIMDPLGMAGAQMPAIQDQQHVRADLWRRLAPGYTRMGGAYLPSPPVRIEAYPAGAAMMTPADHLRFILAFMNGGELDGARILKAESVAEMLSPHRVGSPPDYQQGLMWWVKDQGKPTEEFSHGGAYMFGWVNVGLAYPKLDAALVVSANEWPLPGGGVARDLIQRFLLDWLLLEARGGTPAPAGDWAWRASYVRGLVLVDALQGALGMATRMTPDEVRAMAGAAVVDPAAPGGALGWDPEGFIAGVEDLRGVAITAEGIAAFRDSGRMRVSPEDILAVHRALGGAGEPALFRFLAPASVP